MAGPHSPQAILIAGAGHAAGRMAQALRAQGFEGRLHMVGAETRQPYQRPPLSKEFLAGGTEDLLDLPGLPDWRDLAIDFAPATALQTIDARARRAMLSDGSTLRYDALVMATGARARRLSVPGLPPEAVLHLRDIADARVLRDRLTRGGRLCVIGGGVIGLEVAAFARGLGMEVTIVECGGELMQRVLPAAPAALLRRLHERRGIRVLRGVAPVRGMMSAGPILLELSDGRSIEADVVMAGIGVLPNVEPLTETGLAVADGLVTDAGGRTADPAIFAAGDVARSWRPLLGRSVRLETWRNADEQPAAVATSVLGGEGHHDAVPWMWSDQFDISVQVAGDPLAADREIARAADENGGTFLYLREGRLIGGITIGRSRDMRVIQRLIAGRARVPFEHLADEGRPLVDLLKAEAPSP